MTKSPGGPDRPGKKPPREGGRPGRPGAYSQRLIKKATAGVRPPRFPAGGKSAAKPSEKPERAQRGDRTDDRRDGRSPGRPPKRGLSKRPERNPGYVSGSGGAKPTDLEGTGHRDRPENGQSRFRMRDASARRGHRPTSDADAPKARLDRNRPPDRAPRSHEAGPSGARPRPDRDRADAKPSAPASARPPRGKPAPVRPAATNDTSGSPLERMRIAKAMARSGLCSRRDAERWIAEGRISVNGRTLATPACDVGPTDRILVDGNPLPAAEPAQLWRYYKPRGLVTTHADPEGRPTVFDSLPPGMPRVVSIGRLDFNTEGLLLLTNDGALARHLELPATGWLRRYRVRAFGRVTQAELDALKEGITIEGVRYGGIEATLDSVQAGNMWLTIGLREGKNREVRRILGSLALEVNRLIRVSYGPFQLMDLTPGMIEPVKRRVLADQLGPDAAQFGLTGAIDGYKARQAQLRPGQRKGGDEA